MVLANTQYTHTHIHTHTIHVTGMCPRKAGMPGREESSTELIRAWIHTLWALTPHSPPVGFLPVIVPPQFSQGDTNTTRWPLK